MSPGITRVFHQRQKELRGEVPDVFTYDTLPSPLRTQIVQTMWEVLGDRDEYHNHYDSGASIQVIYKSIVSVLRKEIGVFKLPPEQRSNRDNYLDELTNFIVDEPKVELVLSAIELVCRGIEISASKVNYRRNRFAENVAKDAIAEINARLKSHGIGYEYDGEIIRVDAEHVHVEAVKPALALLRNKNYAGAEQEFRSAFGHYRKGQTKEALSDALKSIESTMKIICDKRIWEYAPTDTAKNLIAICLNNGLIPAFWQSHFAGLRTMLESSVPTARNKTSSHGQGVSIQTVPDHLAGYALNMTASTIVFLVKAEEALP